MDTRNLDLSSLLTPQALLPALKANTNKPMLPAIPQQAAHPPAAADPTTFSPPATRRAPSCIVSRQLVFVCRRIEPTLCKHRIVRLKWMRQWKNLEPITNFGGTPP